MGKYLFIFLMLCSSFVFASPQSIYNRLVQANGIKHPPHLVIISSREVNAWADFNSYEVVVTTSLLRSIHSDNELAIILGHELGHFKIGANEDSADRVGSRLARHAGYDSCKGADWLRRNGGEGDGEHSAASVRVKTVCNA